ncbi:hypothetical protein RFI_10156, partial [Reticulomyxa filosa]
SDAAKAEQLPALIGLVVCAVAFATYGIYQVMDSRSQKIIEMRQRREEFDRWQGNVAHKFGRTDNALRTVFEKFDKDNNGKIDRNELYAGFQAMGLNCSREQIFQIMKFEFFFLHRDMNTDEDVDTLTFDEFASAIKKWSRVLLQHRQNPTEHMIEISDQKENANAEDKGTGKAKGKGKEKEKEKLHSGDAEAIKTETSPLNPKHGDTKERNATKQQEDLQLLEDIWKEGLEEEEEEDELELHLTDRQILWQALLLLFGGTGLCIIFSDPMVNVIDNFSKTIGVNAFYVSFIITPLASNSSEIYSSLLFARKKTTESISLALSSLYGNIYLFIFVLFVEAI